MNCGLICGAWDVGRSSHCSYQMGLHWMFHTIEVNDADICVNLSIYLVLDLAVFD